MRKQLTELTLQNLKPADRPFYVWDALPCFGVRVGARSKSFVLKQNNKYHLLGRYPYISLKSARNQAFQRLGAKYLPKTALPAHTASTTYLEAISREKRPATYKTYSIYLKRLPDLPLSELNHSNLTASLPEAKSAANLCFATFKAFLTWCVNQDYITTNPLSQRKQPNKKATRDRLLTDEEVKEIWLESYNHSAFGAIVRILLLSGQRLNQIVSLKTTWLSSDTAVLQFPAYVMKNNTEHTIPLTPWMAQETIAAPFPKMHISSIMRDFRKELPHIPHWTLHDFRRYFSSTCSKLKVPIDVTEAILSHTTGSRSQIQRIYDRDSRLPQMKEAFDKYHSHLREVLNLPEHP